MAELKNTGRLVARPTTRKTGSETFNIGKESLGFELQDFWRWASSDLLSNALRGVMAEYIVALALGLTDSVRSPWDSFDLLTEDNYRIEVKSAAYIQSWAQTKPSVIAFDIKQTRAWKDETISLKEEVRRQSDIYVFCLLQHPFEDLVNVDPLDVTQWAFYIVPTWVLNESLPEQKKIGLASLQNLKPLLCVPYEKIQEGIKALMITSDDASQYETLLSSYPIPLQSNVTELNLTTRQIAARKAWETIRKNRAEKVSRLNRLAMIDKK